MTWSRIAKTLIFWAALGATFVQAAEGDLQSRLLARHNEARAAVGSPPLAWDARLARDAAQWADHLAKTHSFEHCPQDDLSDPQGENLWMGTSQAYSVEAMVDGWIDEKRFYRPGRFPEVTTTQSWEDVGHYTQLIWENTTRVGCALSNTGEDDVLVCRYAPAGNWDGESPTGARNHELRVAATSFANASAR